MKKPISVFCSLLVASSLVFTGCAGNQSDSPSVMEGEVAGEITVSCYDSMSYKGFLEEAAKAFESKYPGTNVNVEAFGAMPEIKTREDGNMAMVQISKEDDDQARDDYISKVSTELMSGAGADVLAMDVLPYYKYAENGQLEDLNRFIEEDDSFDLSDYRQNIIKAMSYQGGQYILPLDYSFEYLAYDSSLFSAEEQKPLQSSDTFTYKDLIDIAKTPFNTLKNKMFGLSAGAEMRPNMFSELLDQDYDSYIDIAQKSVNLDDGRFAQLLEDVKAYDEAGYINPATGREGQMNTSSFGQDRSERYFYKLKNNFSLLQYFNENNGRGNMVIANGVSSGNEEDDLIAGLTANAEGEAAFTYNQAYGVNANSDNKRTAWEFIKFLLSEEMQTSPQLSIIGSPVHNTARETKAEMVLTGEFRPAGPAGVRMPGGALGANAPGAADEKAVDGGPVLMEGANPEGSQGGPNEQGPANPEGSADIAPATPPVGENPDLSVNSTLSEAQKQAFQDYLVQSEAFADQLSRYIIKDAKIDAMIMTEVKNFFNGTKTAEEVSKTLQSKVELYLNE